MNSTNSNTYTSNNNAPNPNGQEASDESKVTLKVKRLTRLTTSIQRQHIIALAAVITSDKLSIIVCGIVPAKSHKQIVMRVGEILRLKSSKCFTKEGDNTNA
ncbi:hypothetical protein BVY03_05845 [bacterium K02(2017)]|nr:hypothetical protein BVY03_05845 [bacterium K02(2017)]